MQKQPVLELQPPSQLLNPSPSTASSSLKPVLHDEVRPNKWPRPAASLQTLYLQRSLLPVLLQVPSFPGFLLSEGSLAKRSLILWDKTSCRRPCSCSSRSVGSGPLLPGALQEAVPSLAWSPAGGRASPLGLPAVGAPRPFPASPPGHPSSPSPSWAIFPASFEQQEPPFGVCLLLTLPKSGSSSPVPSWSQPVLSPPVATGHMALLST